MVNGTAFQNLYPWKFTRCSRSRLKRPKVDRRRLSRFTGPRVTQNLRRVIKRWSHATLIPVHSTEGSPYKLLRVFLVSCNDIATDVADIFCKTFNFDVTFRKPRIGTFRFPRRRVAGQFSSSKRWLNEHFRVAAVCMTRAYTDHYQNITSQLIIEISARGYRTCGNSAFLYTFSMVCSSVWCTRE